MFLASCLCPANPMAHHSTDLAMGSGEFTSINLWQQGGNGLTKITPFAVQLWSFKSHTYGAPGMETVEGRKTNGLPHSSITHKLMSLAVRQFGTKNLVSAAANGNSRDSQASKDPQSIPEPLDASLWASPGKSA